MNEVIYEVMEEVEREGRPGEGAEWKVESGKLLKLVLLREYLPFYLKRRRRPSLTKHKSTCKKILYLNRFK